MSIPDYLDKLNNRITDMLKSSDKEFVLKKYDLELLQEQWQHASNAAMHKDDTYCDTCFDAFEVLGETCQECCPHDERDHGICLDCEDDISSDGYDYDLEDR